MMKKKGSCVPDGTGTIRFKQIINNNTQTDDDILDPPSVVTHHPLNC